MPISLPTTSPATIPRAMGEPRVDVSPDQPPIATPAEKNAKSGTHTPDDSGRRWCSSRCARPSSRLSRPRGWTGTVKASATPAIVAWTPELSSSAQATTPMGRSTAQGAQRCRRKNRSNTVTTIPYTTTGTTVASRWPTSRSEV
ncbi:hypothetical protein GCM10009785_04720 [Brooklawnia cerclae]